MMTKLSKVLRREVSVPKIKRPIVIGIDPESQTISLKEKGSRREYKIQILTLYALLVRGKG